jgi:hypothetical protein
MAMFLVAACASAQSAGQACQVSALPEGVQSILVSEYPTWRIETLADLDADYQKAWTAKRPTECPGIAAGHFESKDDLSYALLLIPREKGRSGYRFLVVSRKSGKGAFSSTVLDQNDKETSGNPAIFHVDPGMAFNEEKFAAFKLKSEGIYFEFFEASGFIYYWKHGRYQRIVESD